jgi:hypothetical protein
LGTRTSSADASADLVLRRHADDVSLTVTRREADLEIHIIK